MKWFEGGKGRQTLLRSRWFLRLLYVCLAACLQVCAPANALQESRTGSAPLNYQDRMALKAFLQNYAQQVSRVTREFKAELETSGLDELLVAERLLADQGFKQSRQIIARTRAMTAEFGARARALSRKSIDADLRELQLSPEVRSEFRMGLEENFESPNSPLRTTLRAQEQVLVEVEQILDLLEKSRGRWSVEEGQLAFGSDADREKFNGHVEALMNMAARMEEEQKNSSAKFNRFMERLK